MQARLSLEEVSHTIAEALDPRHFTLGGSMTLEWEHLPFEEIPWEVFRGRLLEPRFTRQARTFTSWNVYEVRDHRRSAQPLLSVKLDKDAGQIHITRSLNSYVWESFDSAANVLESRETTRWLTELVGTLLLSDFDDIAALREELTSRIFQAVIGTSRLPLNSVEAPLPAFTFGELGYFHPPASSRLEQTKRLELWLRSTPADDVVQRTRHFIETWQQSGQEKSKLLALLRNVFNEVSLSPYTTFVETTLAFLQALTAHSFLDVADEVDFLSYLLRQTARHLTAYDLFVFHHRGANYPDALLLDSVLKRFLELVEKHPPLTSGPGNRERGRRQALRQGCLIRHQYHGLPVPDAPTSPGENTRVLPAPHARIPEEQILNPAHRTRRLFDHDPLADLLGPRAREVFAHSIADLQHPIELRELGTAVFIDRPLGRGKLTGEPDQTLLLAHECFSADIATRRLSVLRELASSLKLPVPQAEAEIQRFGATGLPISMILTPDRPIIALADAARVAEDFRVIRTLSGSALEFFASFDFEPLRRAVSSKPLVIASVSSAVDQEPVIGMLDANYQRRCEIKVNRELGFRIKGRNEYPVGGLTLMRVWDEGGTLVDAPRVDLTAQPTTGFGG